MKKSLILCLIAAGALLVSGCGEQTVDFGCDEGEKICNKDNNVESCVVCESDGTHTYWVKKTCVMGINSEGNKCNEEVCKYGVDEINKGCLNPAFCVNGWNNDGSCKAVDNCAVKNDNGDNVNEEDGSCKKMEGCLIGNEQDGSCKKVEGCVLGNEQDGSCKKVEGCFLHEWNSDGSCKGCVYGWNDNGTCKKADGCAIEGEWNDDGTCKKVEGCAIADEWNSDGSCKKAEGCAIKGEWNEDGSCKQVEGCAIDGEDKWNEDGSCKHVREDCAFDGEDKWNSDGSCKRIEGCAIDGEDKWNEDGSCKHVREDCAFDGEEKWNRDGSCKRVDGCLNGWNEDGACTCSEVCETKRCDDKGACICDITCLADKGSTCDMKTGTCTCSSKCDAGCHENGLCRTPQSCIKENEKECNNYDYCKSDNCYCNSENVCTRKDKNMNHMLDQYEDLTRNEKECRKYSDCDSSPNSNDGFCDSFIGYKCSTKCTKNEQCLEGFICREDGRCAADSFTTVWSSNLRNIEAFKNIYTGGITDDRRALRFNATSDDCNVYVCWDWNENGKTIEELIKEYPEIEQTKPSDADYDKYPELKTATCPVPFQHFNSCKEISHDYTVKNEDKVNNKYHILDAKSDIVVKMYGELNGFYVSRDGHFRLTDTEINKNYSTIFSGPSRSSLLEINSFGRVRLTNGDIKDSQNNYYGAFEDCYNLKEVSFVDIPLLFNKDNQQVKIDRMFKNCCSFNHTIENWDVSNVISMEDFLNMHLCEQSTQVEIDNCKDNYDNCQTTTESEGPRHEKYTTCHPVIDDASYLRLSPPKPITCDIPFILSIRASAIFVS